MREIRLFGLMSGEWKRPIGREILRHCHTERGSSRYGSPTSHRATPRLHTNFVAEAPQMGLDARRGAGFPPELYDDILQGWKTKPNEADKPIVQAAGESL